MKLVSKLLLNNFYQIIGFSQLWIKKIIIIVNLSIHGFIKKRKKNVYCINYNFTEDKCLKLKNCLYNANLL